MNKSYKSVWNESTGSWVAVSELATGRSKSKRAKTAISKAILTQLAVGGMGLAGASAAMAGDPIKLGTGAVVSVADGVAIGTDAEAAVETNPAYPGRTGAVAIGDQAYASGNGVAFGQNAQASSDSFALGADASAINGSTAIGNGARSFNANTVALGNNAAATAQSAVAVGANSVVSVADGVAIGTDAMADVETDPAFAGRTGAVAIGDQAYASGNGVALGQNAQASSDSFAMGADASATNGGTAVGNSARSFNANTVAVGNNAAATAQSAVAIGANTTAEFANSVALGQASVTDRTNSVSVGSSTVKRQITNVADATQASDAVTLGQLNSAGIVVNSTGGVTNSFVAYDANQAKALITLQGASGTKITNVAAGTVSSASKDAVNGGQLFGVAQSAADAVGGGSTVGADGKITKPTYNINGTSYTSLDSALTGAADSSGSGGGGTDPLAVHYDSAAKTSVTLGAAGAPVKVTNVAAGTTATDAVNFAQLSDVKNTATSANNTLKYMGFGSTKGSQANATGVDSIALGGNSFASKDKALSIGAFSNVSGVNSVALGYGSSATADNTVSFGTMKNTRTLVNISAGVDDNDAVNVGQFGDLMKANASVLQAQALVKSSGGLKSTNLLGGINSLPGDVTPPTPEQLIMAGPTDKTNEIQADGRDSISIGLNTHTTGDNSVASGSNVNTTGENATGMGYSVNTAGLNGVSYGSNVSNMADNAVAIGAGASATVDAESGIAIGNSASSGDVNAVAIGKKALSYGLGSLVVGNTSTVAGDGSVAIGNGNTVTGANTVVLGSNMVGTGTAKKLVSGSNSVVLGNGSDGSLSNVVSIGAAGKERKIVNVAAGATTTDAVNFGQMNTAIAAAAGSGGGDSVVYDTTAHDKVTLGGTGKPAVTLTNVANGKADADAVNMSQLNAMGGKVDSNGNAMNAFVAYDNATSKDTITLMGTSGTTKITKLTNGTLSAASSDAVNGSQLFNTASSAADAIGGGSVLDPATGKISKPSIKIGGTTYDNVSGAVVAAGTAATDALTASTDSVKYDSSAHDKVTLGGTGKPAVTLTNVANGKADADAVNMSQLNAMGGKVDSNGNAMNAFVAYDNATSKDTITLMGTSGTTKITKLTNGTLSAASSDAVNGSQLFNTASSAADAIGGGSVLDPATGKISKPSIKIGGTTYDNVSGAVVAAGTAATDALTASTDSVKYDSSAHDKVTLGGTGKPAVTLTNVANGKADADAVNMSQLNAMGGKVDSNGNAMNAFVAYDNATSKDTITLMGTSGTTKITKLTNGTLSAASSDAVNGSQLFNTASSTAAALGGGAALDPTTGKIITPSFKVGDSTYDTVQGAITAAASTGVASPETVLYDTTAHDKVTFGGTAATKPVTLSNVAAGSAPNDAVNVTQLNAMGGLVDSTGTVLNAFVAYDNATSKDTITLKGTAGTTKITKLTNGTLSAASSDAVNGSQLFNTASSTAAAIGGGATLDPTTGKISKPSITVGTTTYDDLSGAVTAAAALAQTGSTEGVMYDTTAHDKVTLGGTGKPAVTLTNVANGKADADAVNMSQLNAMGGKVDSNGNAMNAFVAYDNATSKDTITLMGTSGTTKITKLTNGTLSAASSDAVNGSQLFNTASSTAAALGGGAALDPTTGKISTPSFKVGDSTYDTVQGAITAAASTGVASPETVLYDTTAHDKVTFGGTAATKPVTLSNVAAGSAPNDAVNVTQLNAMGGLVDSTGTVLNAFVAYDNATSKDTITLKGTAGTTKITKLTNGTLSAASSDAVNGSQLFNTASSAADAIGGGSVLDPATGKISKPSIKIGGTTYDNVSGAVVAAGTAATDALTASTDSVKYDSSAHDKVTLGGTGKPAVTLTNVANGKADADAVNMSQLNAMGGKVDSNGVALNSFVAYDDATKKSVTLGGGTAGTQIHQVADGTSDLDAVNLKQLNAMNSSLIAVGASLKYIRFGASQGMTAMASGTDSIAFGGDAFANGVGSVAIGRKSAASGINAMAFGLGSNASADNSVALGAGSMASDQNTVSVGSYKLQRRVVNVANAQDETDAVNLGQVNELIKESTVAKASLLKSTLRAAVSDAFPPSSLTPDQLVKSGPTDKAGQIEAMGTDSIAMGLNVHATQNGAVAIGQGAASSGNNSVSIGVNTISVGDSSTAIGVNAQAMGDRSLVIGKASYANADDSVAIGNSNIVDDLGLKTVAIGNANTVTGAGSVVIGNSNKLSTANTFVFGSNITGTDLNGKGGANSIVLGNGSDASQSNVLSIGAKGSERKIVNVAAGTTTTDAVNYGQMNKAIADAGTGGGGSTLITQAGAGADLLVGSKTDGTLVNFAGTNGVTRELTGVSAGTKATSAVNLSQLTPVVAALGGGATIDPTTGAVTAPTYSIGDKPVHNAGDAFKAIDTNLTSLNTTVADMAGSTGNGMVVQDPTSRDITVGALNDGNTVNFAGTAGNRRLTGVAAGDVSSSSFDAINGTQLYNAASGLATAIGGGAAVNSDGSITQPSFNVGGNTVHNMGDAITNIDGRVTNNSNSLTELQTTVNNITAGGGVATPNAVAYDSAAHDKLTVGKDSPTATALITGLTAGDISSATSTDAVTGGQLFATNQDVAALQQSVQNIGTTGAAGIGINGINGTNGADGTPAAVASATGSDAIAMGDNASASGDHAVVIGGGASGTGDGTIAIGGKSNASGTDSIAIGNNASAPANNAVALGANSVADRDNSVSMGSEGNERQVTNVAAGTKGTDAVNLNQMNSAVGGVARKAYSGIAAATALTMIPDVDANKTLSIGIGGGTFQGYAATAIGGTARITQNIKVRVGAGWSAAGTTVGAGASYQW